MDTFTLIISAVILIVVIAILAMTIRIANQWERAVVCSWENLSALGAPALFLIVPFLNRVAYMIDLQDYHHIVYR